MWENPRHGWVEIIEDVKVYAIKTEKLKQAFVVATVVVETHYRIPINLTVPIAATPYYSCGGSNFLWTRVKVTG